MLNENQLQRVEELHANGKHITTTANSASQGSQADVQQEQQQQQRQRRAQKKRVIRVYASSSSEEVDELVAEDEEERPRRREGEQEMEEGEDDMWSDSSTPPAHRSGRKRRLEEEESDLSDVPDEEENGNARTQPSQLDAQTQPTCALTAVAATVKRQPRRRVRRRGEDGTFRHASVPRRPVSQSSVTQTSFNALKRTVAAESAKLQRLQACFDQLKSIPEEMKKLKERMASSLAACSSSSSSAAEGRDTRLETSNERQQTLSDNTVPPEIIMIRRFFPWVKTSVAERIGKDVLEPEMLFKLRQPETFGENDMPAVEVTMVVEDGQRKTVKIEPNPNVRISNFLKAVPNLTIFIQVWTVFISIRSFYVRDNAALLGGYTIFLHRIMELAPHCRWESMVRYILSVLHERAGQNDASIWYADSQNHFNRYIATSWTSRREACHQIHHEEERRGNVVASGSTSCSSK